MEFRKNMKKYLTKRSKEVKDDKEAKEILELNSMLKSTGVNINTVISGVVSITSIILVLHYEKVGVICSKAISFIPKMIKETK